MQELANELDSNVNNEDDMLLERVIDHCNQMQVNKQKHFLKIF